jgi:hypothetical protein
MMQLNDSIFNVPMRTDLLQRVVIYQRSLLWRVRLCM